MATIDLKKCMRCASIAKSIENDEWPNVNLHFCNRKNQNYYHLCEVCEHLLNNMEEPSRSLTLCGKSEGNKIHISMPECPECLCKLDLTKPCGRQRCNKGKRHKGTYPPCCKDCMNPKDHEQKSDVTHKMPCICKSDKECPNPLDFTLQHQFNGKWRCKTCYATSNCSKTNPNYIHFDHDRCWAEFKIITGKNIIPIEGYSEIYPQDSCKVEISSSPYPSWCPPLLPCLPPPISPTNQFCIDVLMKYKEELKKDPQSAVEKLNQFVGSLPLTN